MRTSPQNVAQNLGLKLKTAAVGRDPVWVVRDPGPISRMPDVFYETTVARLCAYCVGTGARDWVHENTAIYFNESEAKKDAEDRMSKMTPKKAVELLSTEDYASSFDEKESKFEQGVSVPLEKLPDELQENVKNPPESVKKVTEDMKKASCDCGGACTCGAKSAGSLTFADYASELGLGDKEAKFERGKSMTIDEVAKVVGPEFKEMNENPPESVVNLREEMVAGKTAAGRETHIEDPKKKGFNLCGEKSYSDAMADSPTRATCFYCKSAWQKAHGGHTAGAGLYGMTKDIESVSLAGVRRLQAAVNKIAKEVYARDEETPTFLQEHGKRTGSRAARLLIAAMKDLGPGAALSRVAGGKAGLYGYKERTAKIALAACSDLYHEAGLIAGDLHGRRAAHYDRVTGFLKEHSKAARCQYASMLLEAYPSAPRTASTQDATHLVEVLTNQREASEPSVQEILNLDRIERIAADFLAGATVPADEDEDGGTPKKASVGAERARLVIRRLVNLAEKDVSAELYIINLESIIELMKKVMRYPAAEVMEFQSTLQELMSTRLKTKLATDKVASNPRAFARAVADFLTLLIETPQVEVDPVATEDAITNAVHGLVMTLKRVETLEGQDMAMFIDFLRRFMTLSVKREL